MFYTEELYYSALQHSSLALSLGMAHSTKSAEQNLLSIYHLHQGAPCLTASYVTRR